MTDKDALKIASWLVADELCGERTEYCNKSCVECCIDVQERLRQMANKEAETERPHGERSRKMEIKEARDHIQKLIVYHALDMDEPLTMALDALEKQIPKKSIPQDEDCLECPNCDSFIGYASECQDEHYRVEYCQTCGQAIDWSDDCE